VRNHPGRRPRSAERSRRRWEVGDVEVQDPTPMVSEDDEDEEHTQPSGGHGEEIN
jgi:hypothetical protein